MHKEAHKSIDVDVFKEILENEFFSQEKDETTRDDLIEMVRRINKVEIKVQGSDLDKKKESAKIKHKQFGFRAKTDFKIEFRPDIFENETTICLIPQKIYELEDEVKKLPVPYCEKGKVLKSLLGDAFERLKVKAKNILQNSGSDEQITHYAKKNIQVAQRNCYDARLLLIKIQKTKNSNDIFIIFMANVFLINVVIYLQKMFSSYYKVINNDKIIQKAELYDVMDWNVIMEPKAEYITKKREELEEEIPEDLKIYINGQINIFLTVMYEMRNKEIQNKKMYLSGTDKGFVNWISKGVFDKNGDPIKPATIIKCIKDYNDDKRVKGNKRFDIEPYF